MKSLVFNVLLIVSTARTAIKLISSRLKGKLMNLERIDKLKGILKSNIGG